MRKLGAQMLVLFLASCGGSDGSGTPDAAIDAPSGSCTGACRTTALTATFGATVRTLDRAVYGVTVAAGVEPTLHVEAHRGGSAGCPTDTSPTPNYTLVLGEVPVPVGAATVTSPGNILDFVGDLLGGPLGAAATQVTLTPVAIDVCPTCVGGTAPSDPDGLVALDVDLTFAAGTVRGHLFASHCDSLDTAP